MSTDTLTTSASTARAIADARHQLAACLDAWVCGRTPDSLLVFSELVTNAVTHGEGASRIVVVHGDHTLRFEVHDDVHTTPAVRDSGPTGGFGLRIVGQLCSSWGWDQTATGKVVWSNIDCCADNAG